MAFLVVPSGSSGVLQAIPNLTLNLYSYHKVKKELDKKKNKSSVLESFSRWASPYF